MERQSHVISKKAVYKTIWIITIPFKQIYTSFNVYI